VLNLRYLRATTIASFLLNCAAYSSYWRTIYWPWPRFDLRKLNMLFWSQVVNTYSVMQDAATDIHFHTWWQTVLLTYCLVWCEVLATVVMKRSDFCDLCRITSVSEEHVDSKTKEAASKAAVCKTLDRRRQASSPSYLLVGLFNDRFSTVQIIRCRTEGWLWIVRWEEFELTRCCLLWDTFSQFCHSFVPRIELWVSGIRSISSNDRNVRYQPNYLPVCLEATMPRWAVKTIEKFHAHQRFIREEYSSEPPTPSGKHALQLPPYRMPNQQSIRTVD
jgi:hypothetical protein